MPATRIENVEIIEPRQWRDAADISDIETLARLLDTQFRLPGTNWRFGLDGIIGLMPGLGDLITTAMGGYIVMRAHELGAPRLLVARMVGNLIVDGALGAIPIIGDVFDFAFRAHTKNVRLLLRHLERDGRVQRR